VDKIFAGKTGTPNVGGGGTTGKIGGHPERHAAWERHRKKDRGKPIKGGGPIEGKRWEKTLSGMAMNNIKGGKQVREKPMKTGS